MNQLNIFVRRMVVSVTAVCMFAVMFVTAQATPVKAATVPSIKYGKWSKQAFAGETQKFNCTMKKSGYAVAYINLLNYRLDEEEDYEYDLYNPPALLLTISRRGSRNYEPVYADIDCGVIKTGPIKVSKGDVLRLTVMSEDGQIDQANYKIKVVACERALTWSYLTGPQSMFTCIELKGAPKNKVIWESTDEDVVIVDKKGRVETIKEGECEIIATYNGKEYVCEVVVYYDPAMEPEGDEPIYEEDEGADEWYADEEWE